MVSLSVCLCLFVGYVTVSLLTNLCVIILSLVYKSNISANANGEALIRSFVRLICFFFRNTLFFFDNSTAKRKNILLMFN